MPRVPGWLLNSWLLSRTAAFCAGGGVGAAAHAAAARLRPQREAATEASPPPPPPPLPPCCAEDGHRSAADKAREERMERLVNKLQQMGQERLHRRRKTEDGGTTEEDLIGVVPRQWMEMLDRRHRYAPVLYEYWRRWELSDTRQDFFEWLEEGWGRFLDLPLAPRRLLDEWRVLYLRNEDKPLFELHIEPSTGRFLWGVDGTPVTLPPPSSGATAPPTAREEAAAALLHPALSASRRREELLGDARAAAEEALRAGAAPDPAALRAAAAPLVAEGLLRRVRDPYWEDRLHASSIPGEHSYLRRLSVMPDNLLPGVGWAELLEAVEHDEGRSMRRPLLSADERAANGKAIFVVDHFSRLYCTQKVKGVIHHSSFTRGHCVRVAGSLRIEDGRLVELSPHSGHYRPAKQDVDAMIRDWEDRGVDFSDVAIRGFIKGGT